MRALLLLLSVTLATPLGAETVTLYKTDPAECGTYRSGTLSDGGFFPGGEAGSLTFAEARPVPGLNATAYEAAAVNEGNPVRIGTALVVREFDDAGQDVVRVFTASEPMQEHRVCPD
ncbi:hypothetical protein JANAI62_28240 [Jannaschia pagri]|uniref:Secreted protein n=1 Tax=Jannaschia pagri TaxID=2829797 RepID=A0ABQ4NP61_9RHOB|nr:MULTISPECIES: hypothetical protein [unclassified Jannaschia]GIT92366.1 hypothetical protein JANAI61_28240 [Jannaschia sp. AI_61]GIT96201.1 hypothetical protein JANAI62_28240 [Jannaschia sp. AI_62]